MITCSCGKVLDKIPEWMDAVKVEFVCNNCPNRQTKNIAFVNLEPETPVAKLDDEHEQEDEDTTEDADVEAD